MGVRNLGVWTSLVTFGHVWLVISRHAIEVFQYSFQLSIANEYVYKSAKLQAATMKNAPSRKGQTCPIVPISAYPGPENRLSPPELRYRRYVFFRVSDHFKSFGTYLSTLIFLEICMTNGGT